MIDQIRALAYERFSNGRGSHDWEHSLRVYNLCMHIGPTENADLEVLEIAAYLHDLGRSNQDETNGRICHAQKGAELAIEVLADYAIPEAKRANIVHCVRTHRFRGDHRPETIEAKVLFDADKLDAIGAVGIGRTFLFAGEIGGKLHVPNLQPEDTAPYSEYDTGYREYKVKLCKIKDRMLTRKGQAMAKERHEFMSTFFERFLDEHEGNK